MRADRTGGKLSESLPWTLERASFFPVERREST